MWRLAWLRTLTCALALAWTALAHAQADCAPHITRVQAARAPTDGATRPADGWVPVTSLPDRWTETRWPGYSGTVWYRIDWRHGCPDQAINDPESALALALDSVNMAGELWVGEALLWRDRHLSEPLSRSWNMPRYWQLPNTLLRAGDNSLWVRVVGVAAQSPGLGTIHLGAPDAVRALHDTRWWRQRTLFTLNLMLSAALGVLFFFVWLLQREQVAFGWYALMALCWVLFVSNVLMTEAWPFADTLTVARANASMMVLYVASFCIFIWRFGERRWPRLERVLWALTALLLATLWVVPAAHLGRALQLAGLLSVGAFLTNCVQFVRHAWRTRQPDQLMLSACLLVFIVVTVHDLLLLLHVLPDDPAWTPFSSIAMMAGMSAVLGWRIALNRRRIERFNEELRESIAHARADLSATLSREHALALDNARLQERLHVAHDLHDGLGASLVRAIALLEQTGSELPKSQFLSILKLLRDDLRQVIDSGSSSGATVPETPQQWLAPLRHRFMQLFEELDIQSDWRVPPAWHTAPDALQCLALTRLVEEALVNVIKHSRARHVQVVLTQQADDGVLLLRIEDDGAGFDVLAVLRAGLSVGMRSMQARMLRAGGWLNVESHPGSTVLTAHLTPRSQPQPPPD